MVELKKRWTYAIELEAWRRAVTKINTGIGSTGFRFENIDFVTLYNLYPENCPLPIKEMFDALGTDVRIPDHYFYYSSPVIINTLKPEKPNSVRSYADTWHKNLDKIVLQFKQEFVKCISFNKTLAVALMPHADTLFLTCLFYHNQFWDTYGLNFAGANAFYKAEGLHYSEQPFDFRAVKQVKFISQVIYDYYKYSKAKEKLSITTGSIRNEIADPIIAELIISSLMKSDFPASMSYDGFILKKLLDQKETTELNDWLNELKKFTELEEPDYYRMKRRVLKEYCLTIHKIFSHYLNLPFYSFNGGRLAIYVKILKHFGMEDFDIPQREFEETSNTSRNSASTNRLGSLLRSKRT